MKPQNTSRAQRPELGRQPRVAARASHDRNEANSTASRDPVPDNQDEREKDAEWTGESAASERQQDAAAEDFSSQVEAEGEAALREAILDDLEIEDWEDENPPRLRLEADDGGSVSPEELGEQFLRGAAQQERHTNPDDTEPSGDFDESSDSVHEASLFDSNPEPLVDERFPRITAEETRRLRVNVQPNGGEAPAAPDRAAPRPPPSPSRKVASR